MGILPFALTSFLLLCTALTPLMKHDGALYGVFHVEEFGHTWLIPLAIGAGLATNATVAALALRQSPYLRGIPVPAWYTAMTAATLALAGDVIVSFVTYTIGVGSVSLGLAGICGIWGSVTLWRHRRRMPGSAPTAPIAPSSRTPAPPHPR